MTSVDRSMRRYAPPRIDWEPPEDSARPMHDARRVRQEPAPGFRYDPGRHWGSSRGRGSDQVVGFACERVSGSCCTAWLHDRRCDAGEPAGDARRGPAWHWLVGVEGYTVKLMPGALMEDGRHAGSPEVRASDLQTAFADPEIDVIQTMRGGYGSAQVIPLRLRRDHGDTEGLRRLLRHHGVARGASRSRRVSDILWALPDGRRTPSPSPLTVDRFLQVLGGQTTDWCRRTVTASP